MMFKILFLQSLYNLSGDEMEYQIMAPLSFMRFLGLDLDSRVPDAKTIWLFRSKTGDVPSDLEDVLQVQRIFGKLTFTLIWNNIAE